MTGRRRKLCVVVVLVAYFLMAFGVFWRFHAERWYPLNGDEPHYLIITSGIIHDHTLRSTLPYEQEFDNDKIYAPLHLAKPGSPVTPANAMVVDGPHGQFPFHGIGLPVLLVPGFWWKGDFGALLELVLLSGIAAGAAAWVAARRCSSSLGAVAIGIAVGCGLPLVPGAAQVFPDQAAGIASLLMAVAFYSFRGRRHLAFDIGLAALLLVEPWLNVKYSLPAAIAGAALAWQYRKAGSNRRAALLGGVCILSLAGLAWYDWYAFGHVLGPYQAGNAPVLNSTTVMSTVGMLIDRSQGMFVVQPLLLFGLFWMVRRAVRRDMWALLTLLLFLSLWVPDGLEPASYGGFSFAGRFSSSAAIVLFLPTALALGRLWEHRWRLARLILTASIGVQMAFLAEYTLNRFDFYNAAPNTWLISYPSLWGPVGRLLPALYDANWAYRFWPNLVGVAALAFLVVAAAIGYRRTLLGLGVTIATAYAAAVLYASNPAPTLTWSGDHLLTHIGQLRRTVWVATAPPDKPGLLAQGPLGQFSLGWGLPAGHDTYELEYESSGRSSLGTWDVYSQERPGVGFVPARGVLAGTDGEPRDLYVHFVVGGGPHDWTTVFRTFYGGHGELEIIQLQLARGWVNPPAGSNPPAASNPPAGPALSAEPTR